jgi:hypothetical protein
MLRKPEAHRHVDGKPTIRPNLGGQLQVPATLPPVTQAVWASESVWTVRSDCPLLYRLSRAVKTCERVEGGITGQRHAPVALPPG